MPFSRLTHLCAIIARTQARRNPGDSITLEQFVDHPSRQAWMLKKAQRLMPGAPEQAIEGKMSDTMMALLATYGAGQNTERLERKYGPGPRLALSATHGAARNTAKTWKQLWEATFKEVKRRRWGPPSERVQGVPKGAEGDHPDAPDLAAGRPDKEKGTGWYLDRGDWSPPTASGIPEGTTAAPGGGKSGRGVPIHRGVRKQAMEDAERLSPEGQAAARQELESLLVGLDTLSRRERLGILLYLNEAIHGAVTGTFEAAAQLEFSAEQPGVPAADAEERKARAGRMSNNAQALLDEAGVVRADMFSRRRGAMIIPEQGFTLQDIDRAYGIDPGDIHGAMVTLQQAIIQGRREAGLDWRGRPARPARDAGRSDRKNPRRPRRPRRSRR